MRGSVLFGWRIMPKIWPPIKEHVVYALLPGLRPEPVQQSEPTPYVPESNAALTDEFTAADSVIYYFYKPYCPYCSALEPHLGGLPQKITLPDGTESTVKLVAVNKNDETEGALIAEYYEEYEVPEEEQFGPAVLIGEQYLIPGREIIDELLDALAAGEGTETPLLGENTRH